MRCMHCKGEMVRGAAPFHVDRKGCHVTLDAVPAWVCTQCGQPYFDEKEVETIQGIVASVEKGAKDLALTG